MRKQVHKVYRKTDGKSESIDEMISYEITVPGKPVGKERPRLGRNGRAFTPAKTRQYESKVAKCGVEVIHEPFRERGVSITVECYFSSKVHSDIDNVVKAAMDGLNGIAYEDDRLVDELHGFVYYCEKGEERLEIIVRGIKPDNTEVF